MQSRTPLRVHLLLDNRLEQPFLSFFFYTLNQSHSLDSSCNRPHNRQRRHFILKMQPRPSPACSSPLASHCPLGPTPSSSHTRHRLSPFIPGKRATERVFPDGVRQRPEYSGGLELPSKGTKLIIWKGIHVPCQATFSHLQSESPNAL